MSSQEPLSLAADQSASTESGSSAPPIPLSERQLSSLTDLEIASLTQEIKAESANQRPLIGQKEPLDRLSEEYESSAVKRKVVWLENNGWNALRRARGDGNCFYRSFAFCYLERLIQQPPSFAQLAHAKLESMMPLLDQCGFAKDIYDDFYEPLRDILVALGSSETLKRPSSTTLHESFNDPATSNSIVVYLRLLTSAFLRSNSDDFTPFLFALDDDPRFFEGGAPTMDQFCSFHVEAVDKEADHIQITALTRALGVGLRIAYLDQNEGVGGEVEFVEFEMDREERIEQALLFSINHYDIIYR